MTGIPIVDNQLYAELVEMRNILHYINTLTTILPDDVAKICNLKLDAGKQKLERMPFVIIPIAKLGFDGLLVHFATNHSEKFHIPHYVRDALLHEKLYLLYALLIRRESRYTIEQSIRILERKAPHSDGLRILQRALSRSYTQWQK
jgi:hypothetical protein